MEAANPISWFEEDEAPPPEVKTAAEQETAETPGKGKDFPDVNEVPEKPATESTVEQRRQMMQELSADKANAQYIEETTATESETVEVAEARGDTEVMAEATETKAETMAAQAPAGGTTPAADEIPPPPPPAASGDSILDLDSPLPRRDPGSPPAPSAETPAPPGDTVAAPSPGSSELDEVYEEKLQESAPTVTTAVPGPTESVSGADTGGMESAMEDRPPPPQFEPSKSAAVRAERQMAAATAPGFVTSSTQLATIYFGNNSAAIRSSEAKKIREVAQAYKERGGRLRVYGYASSRTSDMDPLQHQMVNFNVSVRRADAVARALVRQGVKPEDIQTTALSDSRPVYYEVMPAGEAGNRRVEIFVDYY